jgi:hypothetical protein
MKFKLYVLEDGSAGRLSMVLSRSLRSEIDPLLEEALKYVRDRIHPRGFTLNDQRHDVLQGERLCPRDWAA